MCALPKLSVQQRAIGTVQVQHPLRYFSAGDILNRHFNRLHLMPWLDELLPNEKSRGSPALQQRSHFLLNFCLMSYWEHVMFSPLRLRCCMGWV
jgi:hypothetical protein